MATPRLKTFGMSLGRDRLIVAAPSQAEAARLLRTKLHAFREFAGERGNPDEIELASREPGAVWALAHQVGAEWRLLRPAAPLEDA